MNEYNPDPYEAEGIRELFKGDKEGIDNVLSRIMHRVCTCCGVRWTDDDDTEVLDCGHVLCIRCQDNNHQCVACALAM